MARGTLEQKINEDYEARKKRLTQPIKRIIELTNIDGINAKANIREIAQDLLNQIEGGNNCESRFKSVENTEKICAEKC